MKKNDKNIDIVNVDNQGNVIPKAFPVSERTKKDQRKTSVGYTLIAVLLHILAFLPIIGVATVLAVRCYELMPYYSFWPFIGVIVVGVFGLIFLAVTLIVTRKKAKSNIMGQTAKVAITFVCLTTVFGLLLTYILPDIISNATQNTLFVEDLYYNGESQAEANAKLERDFIMYNVLNGNLNNYNAEDGDFSYATLSQRFEELGQFTEYVNQEIEDSYLTYTNTYPTIEEFNRNVLDRLKTSKNEKMKHKYELYEFVYNGYVLQDFDYALLNTIDRRAFAMSIVDYIYAHAGYEQLLKEGFNNKRLKQIFDDNFDNFNHDGYQPFDDPLLLYAQASGRLTAQVILRIILNEGWQYSQGAYDEDGNVYFTADGNLLYEIYDPATRDAFIKDGGEFTYEDTRLNVDGTTIEDNYGFNKDGWMVYESGVVKRPIVWTVLDMQGYGMDLVSLDINSMLGGLLGGILPGNGGSLPPDMVGSVLTGLFQGLGSLVDSVGGLLREDVEKLIEFATNGANINLSILIDDNGELAISLESMNEPYGMLGYAQASWVQSNNLLVAVINVISLRNWLCLFGAVGVVLVIAAGVCRECGKKTRLRTAVSRDRIARANTAQKIADGELDPATLEKEPFDLSAEITPARVVKLEEKQNRSRKLRKRAEKLENEMFGTPTAVEAVEKEEPVVNEEPIADTAEEELFVEEPVADTAEPVSEETGDVADEIAIEEVEEITAEESNEAPEEVIEQTSAEQSDEIAEQPAEEATVGQDNEFVLETVEDTAEQIEEVAETPEEVIEETAEEESNEVAEVVPEVVEDTAEEQSDEVAEVAEVTEQPEWDIAEEPATETEEETAEEQSEEIAEEAQEVKPVKEKKGFFSRWKEKKAAKKAAHEPVEESVEDFAEEPVQEEAEEQAEDDTVDSFEEIAHDEPAPEFVPEAVEEVVADDSNEVAEVAEQPEWDTVAEPATETEEETAEQSEEIAPEVVEETTAEQSNEVVEEVKPVKEKRGLFGRRKKDKKAKMAADEELTEEPTEDFAAAETEPTYDFAEQNNEAATE
ncbi:MAG: hypothetical protein K2M36_01080, partial [Clostridia bacterium]|nr:hypothetical protein [Clostridia bacterium]